MAKIKYKLSKSEIKALIEMLEVIQDHGQYSGLEGKASMALLKKVYLSLLNRWENLKQDKNSISMSWPDVWALRYQMNRVDYLLGSYHFNVRLRLDMVTDQKLIQ